MLRIWHAIQPTTMRICIEAVGVSPCRLEGVLYSLTSCSAELLQLRRPALPDLQHTCAWASQACTKSPAHKKAPKQVAVKHEAASQDAELSKAASM